MLLALLFKVLEMYKIILADPPWQQSKGGKRNVRPDSSGKDFDYSTLNLSDIAVILSKAKTHAEHDHILFLWTIDKYLFDAQRIANNLGYKLHARMIWDKVTGIPAAFTIRFGHEYLLYMYHGKFTPVCRDMRGKIHSIFIEQVMKHSQKPYIAYEIIEALYDGPRLELFARNSRAGWDVWGNEVCCDIKL